MNFFRKGCSRVVGSGTDERPFVFAVSGSERLFGWLAVGPKQRGGEYTTLDLELISFMCSRIGSSPNTSPSPNRQRSTKSWKCWGALRSPRIRWSWLVRNQRKVLTSICTTRRNRRKQIPKSWANFGVRPQAFPAFVDRCLFGEGDVFGDEPNPAAHEADQFKVQVVYSPPRCLGTYSQPSEEALDPLTAKTKRAFIRSASNHAGSNLCERSSLGRDSHQGNDGPFARSIVAGMTRPLVFEKQWLELRPQRRRQIFESQEEEWKQTSRGWIS